MRTSERKDLKRCPQRWWWGWRNGLKPTTVDTKLWFGQGIHVGLAEWYRTGADRGPHPAETWARFVRDEERFIRDGNGLIDQQAWVDARDLGLSLLLEYVDHYGKDDDWDVVATEQAFEAQIRLSDDLVIVYTGTFDGVYRDRRTGKLWLMEHKTAAAIPDTGYLELDDQAGSYYAFAPIVLRHMGIMREDESLEGIMYNFLRKGLPDDRPRNEKGQYLNKNGSVSKVQPKPLFKRHPVWRTDRQSAKMIQNIKNEAQLTMRYRNHDLLPTKTPRVECRWDCNFYQMCQLHEQGQDWEEFRDAMYEVRDPYEDHRLVLKDASL
jgi:hypothetical protein